MSCKECGGSGVVSFVCPDCNGEGSVLVDGILRDCGNCFGSGRMIPEYEMKKGEKIKTFSLPFMILTLKNGRTIFAHKCSDCGGTGHKKTTKTPKKAVADEG
jgi:DnaJ-class molecular chaperone